MDGWMEVVRRCECVGDEANTADGVSWGSAATSLVAWVMYTISRVLAMAKDLLTCNITVSCGLADLTSPTTTQVIVTMTCSKTS